MEVKFYKVGGWVRDKLLGVKSKDLDFSVEAPSFEAMKAEIIARDGVIFLEKPEYATIRARIGREACDYVLCRRDGYYSDGRRPDEVMAGTLHDDLARRDFTMNAMAESENGVLIDPFNGQKSLAEGTIHCVGNAMERFSEDSLRMLRAIRFAITKDMKFDEDIQECLVWQPDLIEKLRAVSTERIREELHKCFKFDTIKTLNMLMKNCHPDILSICFGSLWLKPTSEM